MRRTRNQCTAQAPGVAVSHLFYEASKVIGYHGNFYLIPTVSTQT